jgi:hypothetical protein
MRAAITFVPLLLQGCDPGSFDVVRSATDAASNGVERDAGVVIGADASGLDANVVGPDGQTAREAAVDAQPTMPPDPVQTPTPAGAPDSGAVNTPEGGVTSAPDARTDAAPDGSSDAAADVSAPPACGDIMRDPDNCGACGNRCAAANANASCVAGRCTRTCMNGFADCNADLALDGASNGCEVNTENNLAHCGSCNRACPAPDEGYSLCRARACVNLELQQDAPSPMMSRGGNGPHAFAALCPDGDVLTGIDGRVSNGMIADSLRVRCGRLLLAEGANGPVVRVVANTFPWPSAGGNGLEDSLARPSYQLYCGVDEVALEIQTAVWSYYPDLQGTVYPTIKDVALRCAKIRPSIQHDISIVPSDAPLRTSATAVISSAPESWYADRCTSGVLVGVQGTGGQNLDSLTGYCSGLSIGATSSIMQ